MHDWIKLSREPRTLECQIGLHPQKEDKFQNENYIFFLHHQLRQGARIDMYRGGNDDDMLNFHWCKLYDKLPMYQELMKRHQAPASEKRCGDAMEMVCGIAHATATEGRRLPDGSELLFISEESRSAWIDVWFVFQDMGFTPRVENDIRRQGAVQRL